LIVSFTHRIQTVLKIQSDEVQGVVLVCLFGLLPSVGGAIGSPGIEALFFARFGVRFLPYMYIALGILTMVSTLTLTAALNRIPKSRLFRILPITMAAMLFIARLLLSLDLPTLYPILWLGMYLFWTLQALLIWGVAGMLFDTRQAKRLFPLFAASGIFGNALGGVLTGLLVAWLGTENLLIIWALTLVFSFVLASRLTRAYDPPEVHFHRPEPTIMETLEGGWGSVVGSPLLRWLSISMALLAILLFALAFPFSESVAMQFPGEDKLAGFLGVFQGVTTAFALLLSLGFANRLFAKFGFMGSLLIFALIYATGFMGLIFMSSFTVLVLFRFAQQSWMMGIADTAYQATFNIVPPDKREPARMFVDGIPRQIGVMLSGVFLLILQPILPDQMQFLVSSILAVMCILALWQAREAFTRSLADELDESQIHIFESDQGSFSEFAYDRHAFEVLASSLETGNAALRRMVVDILSRIESPRAHEELLRALLDPEPQIRSIGLRALLRKSKGSQKGEYILQALQDPSAEVRYVGLTALSEDTIASQRVQEQLETLLDDRSMEVRAMTAALLLKHEQNAPALEVLREMAQSHDSQAREQAMQGFQFWGSDQAYDLAAEGLADHNPLVRSRALEVVAQIDPERSLKPIKAALGDPEKLVRISAAQALAAIGPPALPSVLQALQESEFEDGALIALENLPLPASSAELLENISAHVNSALNLGAHFLSLSTTDSSSPQERLLSESLLYHTRSHILQALHAFRLISDRERVSLAIAALQSHDADQCANALELLEALDVGKIIKPALQLWDLSEASDRQLYPHLVETNRIKTIIELLKSEDSWLRACAAFAAQANGESEIDAVLVKLAASDPDPLVREIASARINAEEPMDTISTLPIMDRILFLREVPLFAELSPEELKQVASIAGEHNFKDGEAFVMEGELGDEMYIIVSGSVRVMKGIEHSKQIAQRGPGEFVGEMSILSNEPRMASLVADGDVFALCLEQTNFEQMLLEKPEIGLSVMRALIQRLKDSRTKVLD
jgi:HEAT repeat protein/ATP/ADP translocase